MFVPYSPRRVEPSKELDMPVYREAKLKTKHIRFRTRVIDYQRWGQWGGQLGGQESISKFKCLCSTGVVEPRGIEPLASSLRTMRSPN